MAYQSRFAVRNGKKKVHDHLLVWRIGDIWRFWVTPRRSLGIRVSVTHAHLGPIWHHSESSDVPYSAKQFLGWDFFADSYSKTSLVSPFNFRMEFPISDHCANGRCTCGGGQKGSLFWNWIIYCKVWSTSNLKSCVVFNPKIRFHFKFLW